MHHDYKHQMYKLRFQFQKNISISEPFVRKIK